jgi:hydroxymethylpyrimidine pyrophosphatase-like HAD family hydrolase
MEGRAIAQSGREGGTVRMIAIDMDGTLLGDDGRVSLRNVAALRAAEAAGIEVVIATGRRHSYAMRILRELRLRPASILISSNGTVTRTLGGCSATETIASRLIARTHLPLSTALWLCGHLGEFRNALVLTFDRVGTDGEDVRGALVVEHLAELNASIGRWMTVNEPYIAHIDPIERALDPGLGDPPIQAMLCGTRERMARAEALLLEHPGVHASSDPSGRSAQEADANPRSTFGERAVPLPGAILTLHRTEYPARDLSILDILPAGCSKGAALLSLADGLGIHARQILAIGDNWNDVSMLEIAGTAVLMDNAPEELKGMGAARGWRIGRSNTDDGVAEAIESALAGEVITEPVL